MKKKSIAAVISVLIFSLALSGCKSTVSLSSDGKYALTAPSGYKQLENELNSESILELASDIRSRYIVMLSYSKEGFSSAEEFCEYYAHNLSYTYTVNSSSIEGPMELRGTLTLRLINASLTLNEYTFSCIFYVIETDSDYVVLMCYSTSELKKGDISEFEKIVSTFEQKASSSPLLPSDQPEDGANDTEQNDEGAGEQAQ